MNPEIKNVTPQQKPALDENTWASLFHLAGLGTYVVLPALGGVALTLILWLWKRENSPRLDREGKEALNFEISMFLYLTASSILCWLLIGFAFLPIVILFHVVFSILAALKAKDGIEYKYPFTIRFLK